ncbi:hypothetical protein D0T49_11705 [Paludibacter sp. 221]|nr:hypothetical protein [Paludibacter sp. 221]
MYIIDTPIQKKDDLKKFIFFRIITVFFSKTYLHILTSGFLVEITFYIKMILFHFLTYFQEKRSCFLTRYPKPYTKKSPGEDKKTRINTLIILEKALIIIIRFFIISI